MAYQSGKKNQRGYQVVKTPAPRQDLKTGGESYGQANDVDTPAVVPPGVGDAQTILGKNLRSSVPDTVLDTVIAQGTAGRADNVPADGNEQQRTVSATPYAASHGLHRQQQDYGSIGRNALPAKNGASGADPTDPYVK